MTGDIMLDQLTSLGATGLMGAMWLWERRASQSRERQLDEAHARILSDKVMLEELIEVVRRNTEAITRLTDGSRRDEPKSGGLEPPRPGATRAMTVRE